MLMDQMLMVELRESDPVALVGEAEDSEVDGGMVAAGRGRKAKRADYRCAACGYGIVIYEQPPACPMCSEARWEHVEWRPFSQLLDFPLADLARSAEIDRAIASSPIRIPPSLRKTPTVSTQLTPRSQSRSASGSETRLAVGERRRHGHR
jgi:hypothetical protein